MRTKSPPQESIQYAIANNEHLQRFLAGAIDKAVNDNFGSPVVSQSKAYKMFGRANVERWKHLGMLQERRSESGRIKYYIQDLLQAQDKSFY
ncbi:hypothetical protein HMPREF9134_00471 [Porphyromonas catoniae F0037]|jgi:hypothetical protein|uniref:Uncharacterized protein n=2 Tax=root TaxID=1 RepID=L1NGK1_9PORP|nr:hypothetical protein [Porphyromonas catoniae]EKY02395.1 hypothetical protein HMPREF9134_00471 [Porphyromonas catoniae F0037]DAE31367.1 MAG TPA: hypothetical protein [virus sp. ctDJ83]DAT23085.1 MAG TPA: hypothetical protein [Caudoviricetes sp.]